jgi:hypothetical protein
MTRTSLLAAVVALPLLALSSHAQASSHTRGCALTDRTVRTEAPIQRVDRVIRDTDRALRRTGDRLFNWGERRTRQ